MEMRTAIAVAVFLALGPGAYAQAQADFTVAKDGTGRFTTVQAAFDAVPRNSARRTVIYVKKGTYKENLRLAADRKNVSLIGESVTGVVLTCDHAARKLDSAGREYGTSGSASTYIYGEGFAAANLTFENSSGPDFGPALAIYIQGDKAVFVNCRFLGRQDTMYGDRGRQYFQGCYIEGTTDFIFGPSTAWFEDCALHSYGGTALTAASTEPYVAHGYVFRRCRLTAALGVRTHLGRPWRDHAAVSFQFCDLPAQILPAGWHNWNLPEREKTARYSEHGNTGPGSGVSQRVAWSRQLTASEAATYTLASVLGTTYANPPVRDDWNPLTVAASLVGPTTLAYPALGPAAPAAGRKTPAFRPDGRRTSLKAPGTGSLPAWPW